MLLVKFFIIILPTLAASTIREDTRTGQDEIQCDQTIQELPAYQSYFGGLQKAYGLESDIYRCYSRCGWATSSKTMNNVLASLPTLVVVLGLEGAGLKMWASTVIDPLVQSDLSICMIENDYFGHPLGINIHNNFPFLSEEELLSSMRKNTNNNIENCRLLFTVESFPSGKKKQTGRVMRHNDLVNVQRLHGKFYNVKYFVCMRNVVDSAIVSLSRHSTKSIDHNLRNVESSLVYLESTLKRIPCHQKFLAHFEYFRLDPRSYIEPINRFFGLSGSSSHALTESINAYAKNKKSLPILKFPREVVLSLCKRKDSDKKCYKEVERVYNDFFLKRNHMWPTFAGLTPMHF